MRRRCFSVFADSLGLSALGLQRSGPTLPDFSSDMSSGVSDMRQTCDGAVNIPVDMKGGGSGRTIKPGDIGSPCSKDSDCQQGSGQRVCFKTNLLNDPKGAATPAAIARRCAAAMPTAAAATTALASPVGERLLRRRL